MGTYDESGEFEEIRCLICDASLEQGCEHLLAFADVTFYDEPSGPIRERLDEIGDYVLKVFTEKLASAKPVAFARESVQNLWTLFLEEGVSKSGDHCLPPGRFYDFVLELLEEAGGTEHPGSLLSLSGPHCSSAVRVLFADNPKKVVENAWRLLPDCFAEEKPMTRRRRK